MSRRAAGAALASCEVGENVLHVRGRARAVRSERCETSSSKSLWVSWRVIVKLTVRQ